MKQRRNSLNYLVSISIRFGISSLTFPKDSVIIYIENKKRGKLWIKF